MPEKAPLLVPGTNLQFRIESSEKYIWAARGESSARARTCLEKSNLRSSLVRQTTRKHSCSSTFSLHHLQEECWNVSKV